MMSRISTILQAESIEPIYDTWNSKGDVAEWTIEPEMNFDSYSYQEINIWYINSLVDILDSFSQLIRIWKVVFSPSSDSDIDEISIEWESKSSYDSYLKKVFESIKDYPTAVEELEIKVDLFVFVRTSESKDKPVRAWVRQYDEFLIRGGHEFGNPYICFSLTHTLFAPFTLELEEGNKELHLLNQPLLENALKSWEKKFGFISEFDGSPKIYKYGFLPEDK